MKTTKRYTFEAVKNLVNESGRALILKKGAPDARFSSAIKYHLLFCNSMGICDVFTNLSEVVNFINA